MANQYLDDATAAMTMLNAQWFDANTPTDWNGGSNFWITPTICIEIVNYMSLSGTQAYISTIENARLAGEPYIGHCGYYDDETCWGRFYMIAYNFFNASTSLQHYAANYLEDAKNVYGDLVKGCDKTCGGGLWWQRDPKSYPGNVKAMNATLGLMEIALGLYGATQTADYLATAKTCWSWIASTNMITGGLVIGGLDQNCQPDPDNGPVIALQGNPLAPLWMLYQATSDESYLATGQAIAEATIRQMVWPTASAWTPQGAILQARADVDWNAQGLTYQQKWAGEAPFKGIFAGFLGTFAASLATLQNTTCQTAAQRYASVLAGNATTLTTNFPGGAYGMDWHTPQPDYEPVADGGSGINASLQFSALALFNAAARTAAA